MATQEKQEGAKRVSLSNRDEAKLAGVEQAFPERKDALAYGRKILKVQAGLRATPPPLGTLAKEEGARIYEILGVAMPTRKPRAKTEEPEPVPA